MNTADIEAEVEYTVLQVEGNKESIANALNWCVDTFGPPGPRWFYMHNRFYFKHIKDLSWFMLRW